MNYEALRRSGGPVRAIDLSRELMQPQDMPGFAFEDARDHRGPATLCLHVNGPIVPLALHRLGRELVADKRIVAHWAWELPDLPADWRFGVPFVHDIVVPSRFVADAVRRLCAGKPVHVIPLPVLLNVPEASSTDQPEAGHPFTVLCILNVASSFARKNPCAVIAAFKAAFGDDPSARLVLKVSNIGAYGEARNALLRAIGDANNIELFDRVMSAAEMADLYRSASAVISLHRSEGFGLVPAEAIARGLPVVATEWSGTADFITPETAMPIPSQLVPAIDPQEIYQHPAMVWAEPDVDAAAAALKRLRDDPGLVRSRGQAAKSFAAANWSPEVCSAALVRALTLTSGGAA